MKISIDTNRHHNTRIETALDQITPFMKERMTRYFVEVDFRGGGFWAVVTVDKRMTAFDVEAELVENHGNRDNVQVVTIKNVGWN